MNTSYSIGGEKSSIDIFLSEASAVTAVTAAGGTHVHGAAAMAAAGMLLRRIGLFDFGNVRVHKAVVLIAQ